MKCIILVGGYATRMQPLTLNIPKALLDTHQGKVLDIILENIMESNHIIDEYILVTNDTFYNQFVNWKNGKKHKSKITIISDGSTKEENKVGALSAFVKIVKEKNIKEDVLLLAGDNILNFSLKYIFEEFGRVDNSCIMYYNELDKNKLSKTGVVQLDKEGYISSMEEKPQNPKSNFAVPPFYWIKKRDLMLLLDLFKDDNKLDSMGKIIVNLCSYSKIRAIKMIGNRYDIGSIEEYNKLVENH